MIDLRKLAQAATITVTCEPEYEGPEGCFASGDDAIDAQDVADIRNAMEWNPWAWCVVRVVAELDGVESDPEYLGGCSYDSEKQFREPGGYFDDMRDTALANLAAKLEAVAAGISRLS